jgi:hypothetical protein
MPVSSAARPGQTLLYNIIEQHYPAFRDVMVMQGKSLPLHVQQEFFDVSAQESTSFHLTYA